MVIKLKKGKEAFFNNGKIVINSLSEVGDVIDSICSSSLVVKSSKHKNSGVTTGGITADSLNIAIRKAILRKKSAGFNKETHVENGVFFHDSHEGFDFSKYDKNHNMEVLRNQYIGTNGFHDGENRFISLYTKLGKCESAWKKEIKRMPGTMYEDILTEKNSLTIVGELQFGNWALLYRDLIRLLEADNNPGVDMYIYIASTGKPTSKLSKSIVTYEKAHKLFSETQLLKVPTWLIGLDIE